MAVAKAKKEVKVGEAVDAKEAKLLSWIRSQVPDAAKCPNVQEACIYLANELRKARSTQQKTEGGDSPSEVLAGVRRIEASLQNLKEQFSTMRQFRVGM